MIRCWLGIALVALVTVSAASGARVITLTWQVHDPRWSPNGQQLAYVVTHGEVDSDSGFANPRWRARIWLINANGTNRHPLTPRQFAVQNIAWAPNGNSLAYAAGGHLWRDDVSTGHLAQLTFGAYDDAWWPAWSPDGSTIAYTRHHFGWSIYVVSANGGAPREVTTERERPAWSPDGTRLLLQRPAVFVNLDGSGLTLADSSGCDPRGWSADGTLLVGVQQTAVANGLNLCAFDASTRQRLDGWGTTARISPTSPTLSADNRVFSFTGGFSGRVFLLPRRAALRLLPDSDSASEGPSWSHSGLVAYIARGKCGRHSEVRVASEDGLHSRTLALAC